MDFSIRVRKCKNWEERWKCRTCQKSGWNTELDLNTIIKRLSDKPTIPKSRMPLDWKLKSSNNLASF